jgi:uncharacterized membrane protein
LSRKSIVLLATVALILPMASASVAVTSKSLTLTVYSDGYVNVAQTLSTDPKASTVQVILLSQAVSDLVATDQNGSPLSYSFSGRSNVTVYTLGATEVNVTYSTDNLTAKSGTVWTLRFGAGYNSTLTLPQYSTIESVSGTPYSIGQTNNSPQLTLSPGTWEVSYGVPIGSSSTGTVTTSTGTGPSSESSGLTTVQGAELGAAAAVIITAALGYIWWKRRRLGPISGDLRPDDVQVLNFIQEKGGKVLEPEIRMRFALPKTSAWRQIKRLERMGYVRVTKIGSQNQIELLRERGAAGQSF